MRLNLTGIPQSHFINSYIHLFANIYIRIYIIIYKSLNYICLRSLSVESGRLEFEEFVQLAAKFIVEEDAEAMQKELREAFRLYDKQGNGFIPTTCLKEILKELDDQLTEAELDIMIEEIDSDGSGTVDFDGKFMSVYQQYGCTIGILVSVCMCLLY